MVFMEKQFAEAAFFWKLYFNGWADIVNFSGFLYIDSNSMII